MKDEEIEALLARYRPIARLPPLRAPRAWPWAVAAAALLAIAVGFHARVDAPPPAIDAVRVQAIADQLGGGADAHALATSFVVADTADRVNVAGDMTSFPGPR